jgi:cysteine desulfurase
MTRVYLDWNATTPPLAEAIDAMTLAARTAWANPSSVHGDGRHARTYVEDARSELAELTGYEARDVVLTSGGTEANNLALRSAFAGTKAGSKVGTLVVARVEHPSVVRVAEALEREGLAKVRPLKVDAGGVISLADLEAALAEGHVRLVAIQAVNQETGAIQPVAEAIALAHVRGVPVHVDAVQAYGRIPTGHLFGADTLAIASHKLRGPKGIGALVAKPGAKLAAYTFGGAQERGLRPGTTDPVAAAGFAVALRHAKTGAERYARIAALRDRLEAALEGYAERPAELRPSARAPHVASLLFPGWEGPELVAAMDLEGVSVSSGSACSAGTSEPSPVVSALVGDRARSAVRVSFGEDTTEADLDRAIAAFLRVLARV